MNARATLERRMAEVRERVDRGEDGPPVVRALEDVLSEGYAYALQLDAGARRAGRSAEALTGEMPDLDAVDRLRALAVERRTVESEAAELRAELAELRNAFIRLGGTRVAADGFGAGARRGP